MFRRHLPTNTTTLVSMTTAELPAFVEGDIAISDNGRFVAFISRDTNVVPGDTNNLNDVFVRDLVNNTTELISVRTDGQGTIGDGFINRVGISGDGRFVAFQGFDPNLVANDTNGATDVFLRDRQLQTTTRVSVDNGGGQLNRPSTFEDLSQSGQSVVFSTAAAAIPDDTNDVTDVYVNVLPTGGPSALPNRGHPYSVGPSPARHLSRERALDACPHQQRRGARAVPVVRIESRRGDINLVDDVFLHIRAARQQPTTVE